MRYDPTSFPMMEIRRSIESDMGIILVAIISLAILKTLLIESIGSLETLVAVLMKADDLRTTYSSLADQSISRFRGSYEKIKDLLHPYAGKFNALVGGTMH